MIKVAALLTSTGTKDRKNWLHWVKSGLPVSLTDHGVTRFSVSVFDEDVEPAAHLRINHMEPILDAIAFLFLESANHFDRVSGSFLTDQSLISAYQVREYQRLEEPTPSNQQTFRVPGMMQVALLKVPQSMQRSEWLDIWRESHTQVAIDTQSTFIYRQNVVERCLTENDPGFAGIVEEAFPAEAMSSPMAFYAANDEEELKSHQRRMWASTQRFLQLADLDVLPTSQYCWCSEKA